MLTEIYIQALLVDEDLADQVWDKGEIDDRTAWLAWWLIAGVRYGPKSRHHRIIRTSLVNIQGDCSNRGHC